MPHRRKSLQDFFRQAYGEGKFRKISLHAGFTCPNLDGTKSTQGCVFCDNQTFSPQLQKTDPITFREQLAEGVAKNKRAKKPSRLIAYLQAYSNTHGSLEQIRETLDMICEFPEYQAIHIGTRPDCIDQAKVDLISKYTEVLPITVELGLQSADDLLLHRMNRCHNYSEFEDAMEILQESPLYIGVHLIDGLPGQKEDDLLRTIQRLSVWKFHLLKIHPYLVARNTPLGRRYEQKPFPMNDLETFAKHVREALIYLPPEVALERIHSSAPEELWLGPKWMKNKEEIEKALAQTELALH